jgi:ABC-type Fe3+/spermidine/putrescine transport system ATPase subunit
VPDYLILDHLTKRFDGFVAVDALSLHLEQGEILSLLGPSGSGKTTTLRLLAGFEQADAGRVIVDGQDVTSVTPVNRRFGMVFQHYALFPHLDVGANVAFGLESLGMGKALREARVAESLSLVDLAGFESRAVSELSGGQQQRVALARALAPEPRILLLDEPLSNLDPSLRERTRRELRDLIHRVGITTVLVTHEQEEAFDLGDRIALLREGRLQQVGSPDVLYADPANAFVAGFVGRATRIDGVVQGAGPGVDRPVLLVEGQPWPLPASVRPVVGPATLMIRPEAVQLTDPADGDLSGTVEERRFLGARALFRVKTTQGQVLEVDAESHAASEGQSVGMKFVEPGLHLFATLDE